jgi:hypothetical protein
MRNHCEETGTGRENASCHASHITRHRSAFYALCVCDFLVFFTKSLQKS